MAAAAAKSPLVNLFKDGSLKIPLVGLGTWKSKPGQVYEAVKYAILNGYRHIDCAFIYGNEEEVGKALTEVISSGAVKREDLFVVSKLWHTYHSTNLVVPALKKSLSLLNLDYVDLYLIHHPVGFKEGTTEILPRNADGTPITSDVDYLDTWKGMEEGVSAGLTKAIGVSNFNSVQIQRIIDNCSIRPVCNQVESHPFLAQNQLIAFCRERDIVVVAYSPLGTPDSAKPDEPVLLTQPKILEIAKKYGKSPGQVLIKWQAQRGVVVIPKSVTPSRITENMDIFDFEMTQEEMESIASLDCGYRYLRPSNPEHKYSPYNIPF